ncbi:MAG TPA: hypothetical protein VHI14_11660, partial [Jatrophihabitantaceae bacterium]|nr:hypothetical protein [Jatrophihabitantaceae bacterium]
MSDRLTSTTAPGRVGAAPQTVDRTGRRVSNWPVAAAKATVDTAASTTTATLAPISSRASRRTAAVTG